MTGKSKITALIFLLIFIVSCRPSKGPGIIEYKIDADTQGVIEKVNNIYNTTIVSNDPNPYKAEYEAGFIQGKLQKDQMVPTRDNTWDTYYLADPSHSFPKQIPPSPEELALAQSALKSNWDYTLSFIQKQGSSPVGENLRRLMYRLIGIYHGATGDKPQSLAFDDQWLPVFSDAELSIGYETPEFTFMDLYFLNASADLADFLAFTAPQTSMNLPSKCSAFVVRSGNEIFLTHNSWYGFLDQSQVISFWINGDYLTMNLIYAGILASGTDFGYTNKGLIFNETTHRATYSEPMVDALWMFWRASLAEQFASSLDDFFQYVSLEPSGTYMNGYMLVDVKTGEIGLVEMSYKSFVFYKPDGNGGIAVSTKPEGLDTTYDTEMVTPDYLLGINFPASELVQEELKAQDNRPARKRQFLAQIGSVKDIESAKSLITYTDPMNPLSIFGRWDLGYGETPAPKTVPDGSIDAKAISVSMIQYVFDLKGVLDTSSPNKAFWMKFGSAYIDSKPFIWSQSQWKGWKLRMVPDRIDGDFTLLNMYIR
jgi:hypothetical protein